MTGDLNISASVIIENTLNISGNTYAKHVIPHQSGSGVAGGYVYGYRSFSADDPTPTSLLYWGNMAFLEARVIFGGMETVADTIHDTGIATGGSGTTLIDTGKAWVGDEHVGRVLRKRTFEANGTIHEEYRVITTNDATTVTVTPVFWVNARAGVIYDIATVGERLVQFGTGQRPTSVSITGNFTVGTDTVIWANGTVETGTIISNNIEFTDNITRLGNSATWRSNIDFACLSLDPAPVGANNCTKEFTETSIDYGFVPARSGSITGIGARGTGITILGGVCRLYAYIDGDSTAYIDFALGAIETQINTYAVGTHDFSAGQVIHVGVVEETATCAGLVGVLANVEVSYY